MNLFIALALVALVVAVIAVTGYFAYRKGYNFVYWMFAGGPVGWVILYFLPNLRKGEWLEQQIERKRLLGDCIGMAVTFIVCLSRIIPSASGMLPPDLSLAIALILYVPFAVGVILSVIYLFMPDSKITA
jgi:putative effector of murein hydrolase LrgA (UPF0299 family)